MTRKILNFIQEKTLKSLLLKDKNDKSSQKSFQFKFYS